MFVRRPRPTGWALPSAEACGAVVDRCGIIASGPLPPPQAHFDLSGFGLDPTRYGVTARLETDSDEVRIITADDPVRFAYGETRAIPAVSLVNDIPEAGYLMRVHRTSTAGQSAVLLTILGLYVMFVSALLVLLGNAQLARRLRADAANTSAAWVLLNLFVVFLGIRLALGLRVAYAAPFYDRAAATSVGLWIAFAIMLVLLGRWASWTPAFWHAVRRIEQPVTRLLATGSGSGPEEGQNPSSAEYSSRGDRTMATFGLVGFAASTLGLVWQRPSAGLGVIVGAIGIGAWLTHGLFGSYRAIAAQRPGPLAVLTSDALGAHPSRTFLVAAATAVVLALAIQAPVVALGPVVAVLLLFAGAYVLERRGSDDNLTGRAWTLYAAVMAAACVGLWTFVGLGPVTLLAWLVGAVSGVAVLSRRPTDSDRPRLVEWHDGLLELGRSAFSGIGWIRFLAMRVTSRTRNPLGTLAAKWRASASLRNTRR